MHYQQKRTCSNRVVLQIMCVISVETVERMLVQCSFARAVWFLSSLWSQQQNAPDFCLKESWAGLQTHSDVFWEKLRLWVSWMCWHIWEARNNYMFNGVRPDLQATWQIIKQRLLKKFRFHSLITQVSCLLSFLSPRILNGSRLMMELPYAVLIVHGLVPQIGLADAAVLRNHKGQILDGITGISNTTSAL